MQEQLKSATFIKSALKVSDCPLLKRPQGDVLPEIAVVGRSNVGKSSLLNSLCGIDLAKVSATPGKTRLLNFFRVGDLCALVDLPGYGYAKVPISMREEWGEHIDRYLNTRDALKLILFLIDLRREPNDEDRSFLAWASQADRPVVLILTKADKVPPTHRHRETKRLLNELGDSSIPHVLYSVPGKLGRQELVSAIKAGLAHGSLK